MWTYIRHKPSSFLSLVTTAKALPQAPDRTTDEPGDHPAGTSSTHDSQVKCQRTEYVNNHHNKQASKTKRTCSLMRTGSRVIWIYVCMSAREDFSKHILNGRCPLCCLCPFQMHYLQEEEDKGGGLTLQETARLSDEGAGERKKRWREQAVKNRFGAAQLAEERTTNRVDVVPQDKGPHACHTRHLLASSQRLCEGPPPTSRHSPATVGLNARPFNSWQARGAGFNLQSAAGLQHHTKGEIPLLTVNHLP